VGVCDGRRTASVKRFKAGRCLPRVVKQVEALLSWKAFPPNLLDPVRDRRAVTGLTS